MKRITSLKKRWSTDQLITGVELSKWLEILGSVGYNVSPAYLHRALWISAWTLPVSAAGAVEEALYGRRLDEMPVDPTPLFILGHWRSGTTHLHNLLGRLPDHTYPTVYQAIFPNAFLTTGKVVPRLTEKLLGETRTYDAVKHGWQEAAEDEIALAKLTGFSPYLSFMFPEVGARYERYVDFMEVMPKEREIWKAAFIRFVKRIMLATDGKRVMVKSCTHTARIRILLEMFPDAKFVFIHRNPYRTFESMMHMRGHTDWENFFQVPPENWDDQSEREALVLGEKIFGRYLEDRSIIPKDRLIELRYSDLCGNESAQIQRIFEQFELPGWDRARPVLEQYLAGLKGYKRNVLNISDRRKRAVWERWRPVFDAFEYSQEGTDD